MCALALAGCSSKAAPAKPKTFAMHGVTNITDVTGFDRLDDETCAGSGGYDDLAEGAQVTVSDAAGKTIALGELGPGKVVSAGDVVGGCQFRFTVKDVPAGQKFYGVEVSHRGVVRYTADDAHERIVLSIGS